MKEVEGHNVAHQRAPNFLLMSLLKFNDLPPVLLLDLFFGHKNLLQFLTSDTQSDSLGQDSQRSTKTIPTFNTYI